MRWRCPCAPFALEPSPSPTAWKMLLQSLFRYCRTVAAMQVFWHGLTSCNACHARPEHPNPQRPSSAWTLRSPTSIAHPTLSLLSDGSSGGSYSPHRGWPAAGGANLQVRTNESVSYYFCCIYDTPSFRRLLRLRPPNASECPSPSCCLRKRSQYAARTSRGFPTRLHRGVISTKHFHQDSCLLH